MPVINPAEVWTGDQEWDRIIVDERRRPALSQLLDHYELGLETNALSFPKVAEGDFVRSA